MAITIIEKCTEFSVSFLMACMLNCWHVLDAYIGERILQYLFLYFPGITS